MRYGQAREEQTVAVLFLLGVIHCSSSQITYPGSPLSLHQTKWLSIISYLRYPKTSTKHDKDTLRTMLIVPVRMFPLSSFLFPLISFSCLLISFNFLLLPLIVLLFPLVVSLISFNFPFISFIVYLIPFTVTFLFISFIVHLISFYLGGHVHFSLFNTVFMFWGSGIL